VSMSPPAPPLPPSFPTRRSSDLTIRVNRTSHELFARPALAHEEHRHLARGNPIDELQELADGGALPHDRVVAVARLLPAACVERSEEHTSELQSLTNLVCRLLLE